METRRPDLPTRSSGALAGVAQGAEHRDHFLRLMLFKASAPTVDQGRTPLPGRLEGAYAPLKQWAARQQDRFQLPIPVELVPVSMDSAATDVMTDLRRVDAVTVDHAMAIEDANQLMIARQVRALFVVDETRKLLGIITATDILGERPIRFAQERGIRRHDVLVRDIMTRAERLEILDLRDVQRARVGDVVATLKRSSRQHALAVETGSEGAGGTTWVRGIFSLTRIARQLGLPEPQGHDLPRTFAEIEAIIGP